MHSTIELRTDVEADDRLQTLSKAHHHHDNEHSHTIHNSIDTHIRVAFGSTLRHQRTVDDDDNQTVAEIDTEGREADSKYLLDDIHAHFEADTGKMHEVGLVEEETELEDPGTDLTHHSSQSCSAHSPTETKDEQGIEDDIDDDCDELGCHGFTRIARRSQLVVHAEESVGDDIAGKDDLHIVVCIRQGGIAGTEQPQYRIEEQKSKHRDEQTDGDIKTKHVAKNHQRTLLVALSHLDRCLCG